MMLVMCYVDVILKCMRGRRVARLVPVARVHRGYGDDEIAKVGVEKVMTTYQTLERKLADQELSRLLVATNLTQSDGTGLVAVRLLDTAGGGRALAGGLGGELLPRGLATSGLAGGLLGAGHCECCLLMED